MTTKISLCMIVKDEEQNIGRCLQSVTGAVDEIIVVDTGSGDKTCQIAQSYGAKVRTFTWNDNFSDARNVSLDLATGDWILILDADEELAKESGAILRKAVLNQEAEGYYVKIVNVSGDDSFPETSADMVFRVFRNRPEYRFRGAVHEQISDAIIEKNGQPLFEFIEDLVVLHDGYLSSHLQGKDKIRRNLVLLEKELGNKPDDWVVRFHYAAELCRAGEYLPAAREFEKLATLINVREVTLGPRLMRYIVHAYYLANEPAAALTAVQQGLALFPDYADLHFYGGQIYLQLKEYGLAYEYFQKALQTPAQPAHYASVAGVQGFRSSYHLGQIAEKFCNKEEALRYYIDSLRGNSQLIAALNRIVEILQPRTNPDYTKYAINKICDISPPQAKLLIGQLMCSHAAYGLALEYFEKVPDAFLTADLLLWKAICLIQLRRSMEALNILEVIDGPDNLNPNAKFNKLLCFWFEDDRQKVREIGGELQAIGLLADMAVVVDLLMNGNTGNELKIIGSEGMTLLLGILKRALELGEIKRSILLLSSVSPQSLDNYYLPLSEVFYQYGHDELAGRYLCQHIQNNGNSDSAYFLLAEIKQKQGAYFDAIAYYQQALQLDPKEPKYYVKLIQLYEKMRCELLKQAAQKYPESSVFDVLLAEAGEPHDK